MMTTNTATATLYAREPVPAAPASTPPRLARLARIELRKAVDTRAGRWLLAVIALVAVIAAAVASLAGHDSEHTLRHILSNTASFTSLLLPVLGVLLVTSEWSQRTALTTFTLVPRRRRVIAAKILAGSALSLAAAVVCAGLALAGTALSTHGSAHDTWHAAGSAIAYSVLFQVLNVLLGIGFGLVFLNTPFAIVFYFVLPTAWGIITSSAHALNSTGDWLDPSTAWGHLTDATMTAVTWAQVTASSAVWVLLPLAIGTARVLRKAVS
jgi:ABC-type transport system involved in multi-copper enzyme maturation permease subunit